MVEIKLSVTIDDMDSLSDNGELGHVFASLAAVGTNISIDEHRVSLDSLEQVVTQTIGGLPGTQEDYFPGRMGSRQAATAIVAVLQLPSLALNALTVDGGCECTGCFWPQDSAVPKPSWYI